MAASETSSRSVTDRSSSTVSTKDKAVSFVDPGGPDPVLNLFLIPGCRRIVAVDSSVKLDK